MFPIGLMAFEILDKGIQLLIPHDEMSIAVRGAGMHEIEIYLLILVRQREISVSPHSLREIPGFVGQRVFTEDHAPYESLGSGGIVGIRISGLQQALEMLVMMIGEFHEHEHIGIRISDRFLDSCIIGIVFMDIGEKDLDAS